MKGFALFRGNLVYVLESNRKNVTDSVARKFVDEICDRLDMPQDTREKVYADKRFMKAFKSTIGRCELHMIDTGKIKYYSIQGDNYTQSIPMDESDCIIIVGKGELKNYG